MTKLCAFEYRKMLAGRFPACFIAAMLILNGALFLRPWEAADRALENTTREYAGFYRYLDALDDGAFSEQADLFAAAMDPDAEPPPDLDLPGLVLPTRMDEIGARFYYFFRMRSLRQIPETRATYVENAIRFGALAIERGDAYAQRMNADVAARYSAAIYMRTADAPQGTPRSHVLSVFPPDGWAMFLGYEADSLFVALILLFLITRLHSVERASGTTALIGSTPRGRRPVFIAKIIVTICAGAAVSALFSLTQILMAAWRHGLWDPGASMMSHGISLGNFMEDIPVLFSRWQAALVFSLFKIAGAVCFAAVFGAIAHFLRGGLPSMLAGAIWPGASFLYHELLYTNADLPYGLRLLPDVTLWSRPSGLLSAYRAANVFGHPVQWEWLCLALWSLLAAASAFIVLRSRRARERISRA